MSGARARRLLGSLGGLGRLPAPGTLASAATVVALLLVCGARGRGAGAGLPPGAQFLLAAGAAVAVALLGIVVGQRAAADWGGEDPGAFVLDEVAGQLLALLPLLPGPVAPLGAALAFALFRALDIAKPWPIARLERLPGGVGIMADDLAAGALAAAGVAAAGAAGWFH